MIITNNIFKNNLKNYLNKNTKLSREVKSGNLFKIVNGLYETDKNTPAYLLAGSIYGPSYISFEYALSYYGLIPERVNVVTCATFNKKKKKVFKTTFGVFTYRDIPELAYSQEVLLKQENGYSYQIASMEKALCDKLYALNHIKDISSLEDMLFNDLRIDINVFKELDKDKIDYLSGFYHSNNVKLLSKYIRRDINE